MCTHPTMPCTNCRRPGHNVRTCPFAQPQTDLPQRSPAEVDARANEIAQAIVAQLEEASRARNPPIERFEFPNEEEMPTEFARQYWEQFVTPTQSPQRDQSEAEHLHYVCNVEPILQNVQNILFDNQTSIPEGLYLKLMNALVGR